MVAGRDNTKHDKESGQGRNNKKMTKNKGGGAGERCMMTLGWRSKRKMEQQVIKKLLEEYQDVFKEPTELPHVREELSTKSISIKEPFPLRCNPTGTSIYKEGD